ncbi:MAG: DASS family sodium-coupled anion symporter [Candidatus Glassbacteria bacterium]|nr:DASS family sodium-coupled anion symporter [Candidatus Glassbacteria bacterium]
MNQLDTDSSLRPTVGLVLGPLLFVLLLCLPTPQGLEPEAMRMAAVAALMAVWWITEAIPIPATALLPLPLFPLLGIMAARATPLSYADRMIYLFFGGFTIAIAMQKVGLHRRMALHIIRAIGSSPSRLLLGFMVASSFLSMWISNTATAMMMLPIGMAVVLQMSDTGDSVTDEQFRRSFGLVLMLGIAYAASIGGIGTLVGTPPNIVMAGFVKQLFPDAPEINFLQWMLLGLPVVVTFVPIVWLYLVRRGCGVHLRELGGADNRSGAAYIAEQIRKLGRMRWGEKAVLTVFALTALGWIFRKPINLGFYSIWGLTEAFPLIDDSTVAMTMGLSLFLIPTGRGSGQRFLLDWKTVNEGMPWGLLILYGGGFALARGMEATGLALWLGGQLTWLGSMPVPVMILATCLMVTFLTEITSNTATTTMLIPVLATAAVAMGTHPYLLMIPATISASCAFMLPVATPTNAVVFGSGWVRIPEMARAGLWLNFIGVALVTVIVYTVGLAVFDINPGVVPEWASHMAGGR